jgi:hypothetical protein
MDLSKTIEPKSNQLNFDDFLGKGSLTVKITDVKGGDEPQQPVAIHYEGDSGKPYLPCKSMRRVLVSVWGADGKKYIGKTLILYGDPNVVFGGQKVGGIRISHMSDIDKPVTMALSVSKANKKPFTVQPLVATPKVKPELTPEYKGWDGAKKAFSEGTYTIEQLKDMYTISEANEKLLKAK